MMYRKDSVQNNAVNVLREFTWLTAEYHQVAADLLTSPTDLGYESACRLMYPLLLLPFIVITEPES